MVNNSQLAVRPLPRKITHCLESQNGGTEGVVLQRPHAATRYNTTGCISGVSRARSFQAALRCLGTLTVAIGLLGCCGPGPKPPPGRNDAQKRLAVPYHFQEDNQLCWAAGVEMVTDYPPSAQRRVSQCQQVTDAWVTAGGAGPKPDCCNPKPGDGCNFISQPRFDRFGYRFKRGKPGCQLTWEQIKAEIDADRPFLYDYKYVARDGAHLEVVAGYQEIGGEKTLFAYDPNSGVKIEWFDTYFAHGPDFRHQLDYFEIRHDPSNQGRVDACQ